MNDLIVELSDELRGHRANYVQRCEEILGRIAGLRDPSFIGLLLPLLDDRAEYDELMFSIIHTLESFDDATYVGRILEHLPEFLAKSPRFAKIVHMRILNSSQASLAYRSAVKKLSDQEKDAARVVLGAVRRSNARFEAPVAILLAAMNSDYSAS